MNTVEVAFIATQHVTNNARIWLDKQGLLAANDSPDDQPIINIASTTQGWWIYCGTAEIALTTPAIPASVVRLMLYIQSKGYDYVCLDKTAAAVEELPFYQWEDDEVPEEE